MAEYAPPTAGLGARLKFALKPKKSRGRLTKKPPSDHISAEIVRRNNETIARSAAALNVRTLPTDLHTTRAAVVDTQTGERRDVTAMLHGLHDTFEPGDPHVHAEVDEYREPGEPMIASLSPKLWRRIGEYLSPADAASLAFSSKTLLYILGPEPWAALRLPEHHQHRIDFLVPMDRHLPDQLLCFLCATYHFRIQPGEERLKAPGVLNPLFLCPNAQNPLLKSPRTRLTPNRNLPFIFVQLAMRAHRHSPEYGIACESLSRRWKDMDGGWSHQTRYHIANGHLLLRVVSQCFAPAGLPPTGQRHLLYSREDYTPYFSVCAHWRDGELMNLCKCALSHIPKPRQGSGLEQQLAKRADTHFKAHVPTTNQIVTQCPDCRSIRRCPECPTEYLIELKLAEDKSDHCNRFKQAISVTRWSDLGDGTTPSSPEWAACNGEVDFDSFTAIGKRAISGIFESQSGDFIPGQRVRSLNPKNEKRGEEGHNWY